jgi:hypothetical protein
MNVSELRRPCGRRGENVGYSGIATCGSAGRRLEGDRIDPNHYRAFFVKPTWLFSGLPCETLRCARTATLQTPVISVSTGANRVGFENNGRNETIFKTITA